MSAQATLGVVVPCRNEAQVVERRIANLAWSRWPEPRAERHAVVIVDDGSDDGTAQRARAALTLHAERFAAAHVEARVVANDVRPGKPGAIASGLAQLAGATDLVVLTDADVVGERDALVALAAAFEREPALAMACAAQRFVESLAAGGTPHAADGGALNDAADAFDRWTARVRRFESRSGRLFSVHGQLLAWRADLGLRATPGIAADDLDLMLQVRSRSEAPDHVALVPEATFVEVKSSGPGARDQALRRARAYVQVVRAWDDQPPVQGRWQWRFYRYVPLAAPWLTLAAALLAVLVAGLLGGVPLALAVVLFGASVAVTLGRGWLRLVRCIHDADRAQRAEPLPERWEMARR